VAGGHVAVDVEHLAGDEPGWRREQAHHGTVTGHTPPVFQRGRQVRVTYSANGVTRQQEAVAAPDDHVRLAANLDDPAFTQDAVVRVEIAPRP
jgi:hypothetical protein